MFDLSVGFASIFRRSGYDLRAELQFLHVHLHQFLFGVSDFGSRVSAGSTINSP